ncbi:MAG: hypothetical protein HYV07_14165 [Deltaproteobacteria bacterium]|nr:hypothetical protein [Deltaproteobacteria bacterium]
MIDAFAIGCEEALVAARYLEATSRRPRFEVLKPSPSVLDPAAISPRPLGSPRFVTLNGSGNRHHETLGLVRAALEHHPSLVYVQVDAHPDLGPVTANVTCGSFVGALLDDERVEQIFLLGQYPPCVLAEHYPTVYTDSLPELSARYFDAVHKYLVEPCPYDEVFWPFDPSHVAAARRNSSVSRALEIDQPPPRPRNRKLQAPALPERTLVVSWKTLSSFDLRTLRDRPIYLSVDLDVVRDRPVTDWRREDDHSNEGNMSWEELLELVDRIGSTRRVMAADVCGLTHEISSLEASTRDDSLAAVGEIFEALYLAVSGSRGS